MLFRSTVPKEVYRDSDTSYLRLAGGNPASTGATVLMFGSTHATAPGRVALSATGTGEIQSSTVAGNHVWTISTEQMRLTSTGLGIGATPAAKLDVYAGATGAWHRFEANAVNESLYSNYNASSGYQTMGLAASIFKFYTGAAGGGKIGRAHV